MNAKQAGFKLTVRVLDMAAEVCDDMANAMAARPDEYNQDHIEGATLCAASIRRLARGVESRYNTEEVTP